VITLLHLADLHIGVENYGRIDPTSGLHTRLIDVLDRLDEAIDLGIARNVDAVLIAGDIYKNRTPNPTHQREFARRLQRLRAEGIPVVIITGNHDVAPTTGRAHSVEVFNTLALDGVTVIDRPSAQPVTTRSGTFQLITLPWVMRHVLMTREETRDLSLLEIDQVMLNRIAEFLARSVAGLDPQLPTVLMAHATIDGATTGAERQLLLGKDLLLNRSVVALPGVDYVAMGHIHRHQHLGEQPPIVYPGSLERIDFGEEGEDKGCVIVELARGATRWAFHRLAARAFHTIDVDVRHVNDAAAVIETAISRVALAGSVVRLQIRATANQRAVLRAVDLRRRLEAADASYVGDITIAVDHAPRAHIGSDDSIDGITPRQALQRYLQGVKHDAGEVMVLLEVAEQTCFAAPDERE